MDLNNDKDVQEITNDALELIDGFNNFLKNTILELEGYDTSDFESLRKDYYENFHERNGTNYKITVTESYLNQLYQERTRLTTQVNYNPDSIGTEIFNNPKNITKIIKIHSAFLFVIMFNTKSFLEFIIKSGIFLSISGIAYQLNKSYFVSNEYKENLIPLLNALEKEIKINEIGLETLNKIKILYEKIMYFQEMKMEEIAPLNENETYEEFVKRTFPNPLNSRYYEIEEKPKVKRRKR